MLPDWTSYPSSRSTFFRFLLFEPDVAVGFAPESGLGIATFLGLGIFGGLAISDLSNRRCDIVDTRDNEASELLSFIPWMDDRLKNHFHFVT